MIRAGIDTNVLISGLLSPAGNEALIILAIPQRLISPCLSEAMLQEYAAVLARPKFAFQASVAPNLLTMLKTNGEFVTPEMSLIRSPDPADTKFLHCALATQADFILTGNRRDFPADFYGTTKIVNARELLNRITAEYDPCQTPLRRRRNR